MPAKSPASGKQETLIRRHPAGGVGMWESGAWGRIPKRDGKSWESPRWAQDGQRVAFDSRVAGKGKIFTVSAEDGAPRQLMFGSAEDVVPFWSRAGHWRYFASNRSGKYSMMQRRRIVVACLALALFSQVVLAHVLSGRPNWVGSWAASEQIPEPRNSLAPGDLRDATLRQIVHLSIGGKVLRVHISNAFGTTPLHLTSVHIARPLSPASSRIDVSTDRALSFSGRSNVIIPAGAEYISDPIAFVAAPESNLAITFHIDQPPAQETSHPGSRSTSYLVHGDDVAAADLPGAMIFDHWFNIAGVDVIAPAGAASVVSLGDSITDGHASTTNGNDRWPDDFGRRLLAVMPAGHLSILNQGIGGNRLLLDGLGPNALARFDRDVLAQPGVRYLIVLEGINDIGTFGLAGSPPQSAHEALVRRIIGAYEQIVLRAHAQGIRVFGGTITPFAGSTYYKPGPLSIADRDAVNRWIRTPGRFDAVIDFDNAVRDPKRPEHLLPAYDSGDHLHPSPAGYRAMAGAVPLSLFRQ